MSSSPKRASAIKVPNNTIEASAEPLKRPFLVSLQMLCDLLAAYDLVAILASGLLARYVYPGEATPILEYLSLILVTAVFFQFVARQTGLYDASKIENFSSQLYSMLYVFMATFAITFMMLFFLKISTYFSRIWFVDWSMILLTLLSLGRGVFAKQFRRLQRTGAFRRSIALIGEGPQFTRINTLLSNDKHHFRLTEVLELPKAFSAPDQDCLQRFIERARLNDVDEVFVALPATQSRLLDSIVGQTHSLAADIHIVPDLGDTKLPLMRLHRVGDFAFITTVPRPIKGWGVLQKKVEDYTLAAIGLALVLPVMLMIALAIKLDSKGPVIFRQRRHGYNHRIIEVMKFRTMTVLEDGDAVSQAKKGDKRVTLVGWFLRRTSLDELPQLINVLRGEMSIVGPRPHALAHNSYYGDLVVNYANRHRVKPGITGWAQVHGCRGETDHPQKMSERVRYDLEYIENWSIWLDLKVILMTPLFGLFRGAY
jgi:Undecaprenyl-phosphate glucose phosphotransferase